MDSQRGMIGNREFEVTLHTGVVSRCKTGYNLSISSRKEGHQHQTFISWAEA